VNILSLDLGRKCGFAYGDIGTIPTSGSIVLRAAGADNAIALGALGRWLDGHIRLRPGNKPDIIVCEHWLAPRAQQSGAAVEDALRLNGVVHGIASAYGIEVSEPYASTVRSQVCGRVSVPGVGLRGVRKVSNTKIMIIDTMIMRGYLPQGCDDDDRADACALWCWAAANLGRAMLRSVAAPVR
jgi:hypothetical protein